MLVLSRRPDEEIVFPNTGIKLRILRMQGNVVRIGIDAPPEIEILRHELVTSDTWKPTRQRKTAPVTHDLRNKLNKVTLNLYRFQQQWEAGQTEDANATVHQVLKILEQLDGELMPAKPIEVPHINRRCRTLIVEDDANERELLAGILGMNGCECQTAADGQDALDYLASHELPDIVLLDMGLPRVSGPEMLTHLRNEPRCQGLKVFAISGRSQSELNIPTGAGGVDAWFHKPLNPRRLWETIQTSLAAEVASN